MLRSLEWLYNIYILRLFIKYVKSKEKEGDLSNPIYIYQIIINLIPKED